ncbi:MAG: TIGR04084 family radical SAM/SPASM domain-containing protein [Asgard group archaeon]|nr:TIGR04084 family radical SAM/SPASM domain-containing protein [Asgard group archaeon]
MILTRACNLKCKYCGEDAAFEKPPIDIAYPLKSLEDFLIKDSSEITIQFYGGEPLIRIPLLQRIMDTIVNVKHWSIQTNAINLHKLPLQYLRRLSTILISIDGREDVNDTNRGKGVYKKVLENCVNAGKKGFTGDLIARMTISEASDIYEDVKHLALLENPSFDHIHWQIDSQWDDDPYVRWNNFPKWIDQSYNTGIRKLIRWWVDNLCEGQFIGLVPFIPVMKSILFNIPNDLRCGAGLDSFAINPDGSISVCPISPEFEFSIVGHIFNDDPKSIKNSLKVIQPCPNCSEFNLCGGRCLFINRTKLWGEELFTKVCGTVKNMISELQTHKQTILELINNGIISKEKFDYPRFNNGCEIIP